MVNPVMRQSQRNFPPPAVQPSPGVKTSAVSTSEETERGHVFLCGARKLEYALKIQTESFHRVSFPRRASESLLIVLLGKLLVELCEHQAAREFVTSLNF